MTHHLATILHVTDRQAGNRRNTVPTARPLVWSTKKLSEEANRKWPMADKMVT